MSASDTALTPAGSVRVRQFVPCATVCFVGLLVLAGMTLLVSAAEGVASVTQVRSRALDAWLDGAVPYPGALPSDPMRTAALEASATADGLQVRWRPAADASAPGAEDIAATLWWSVDAPDRVASRHWIRAPLLREFDVWTAVLPWRSRHEPVVYFVQEQDRGVSRMRAADPKLAGPDGPVVFWTGHLDGLESGLEAWSLASARIQPSPLSWSDEAWRGQRSLRIEVPAGRASVVAGTPQVRGWMLMERDVRSVRVMARAVRGAGRVRLGLQTRTQAGELSVHEDSREWEVTESWMRVELVVSDLPRLTRRDVGWFTIQFRAEPGAALLVDELELEVR